MMADSLAWAQLFALELGYAVVWKQVVAHHVSQTARVCWVAQEEADDLGIVPIYYNKYKSLIHTSREGEQRRRGE
jgi:hypothetical protein